MLYDDFKSHFFSNKISLNMLYVWYVVDNIWNTTTNIFFVFLCKYIFEKILPHFQIGEKATIYSYSCMTIAWLNKNDTKDIYSSFPLSLWVFCSMLSVYRGNDMDFRIGRWYASSAIVVFFVRKEHTFFSNMWNDL